VSLTIPVLRKLKSCR